MSTSTAVAVTNSASVGLRSRPQSTAQNVASTPAVPSPGRFKHPAMATIAKRRSAETFTTANVQVAVVNTVLFVATILGSKYLYMPLDLIVQALKLEQISLDSYWIVSFLRFMLLANVYFAVRPLLPYGEREDIAEDIPLTPSQRALLGLRQSRSSTPSSQQAGNYITPPRYRRSSPSGTPQSGASGRSISANYSASPLSTSRFTVGFSPTPQQGSVTPGRRSSGSQFAQSPLFKKSIPNSASIGDIASNTDFSESTRSLLNGNVSLSSTLRRSQSMRERLGKQQEPGTPSPGAKERNKIKLQPGVNYKWLYDRGGKIGPNGNPEF